MTISRPKLALSILAFILLISCYERKVDCLDTLATNYNLATDKACDDCCTYPAIELFYNHWVGDSITYSPDSILVNQLGQNYRIDSFEFILNNFHFTFEDDEILQVKEMSEFENLSTDDNLFLVNDFLLINEKMKLGTVGTMRKQGNIQQIDFSVGIDKSIRATDLNHFLSKSDSTTTNNFYPNFVISISYGNDFEENKLIKLINPSFSYQESYDVLIAKHNLSKTTINVIFKYNKIFDNIDLYNDIKEDQFFDILINQEWIDIK